MTRVDDALASLAVAQEALITADEAVAEAVRLLEQPGPSPYRRTGFWVVDYWLPDEPLPDWVTGVLLDDDWANLEPTANTYNFTGWFERLAWCQATGKQACLNVRAGIGAPGWLYNETHNVKKFKATRFSPSGSGSSSTVTVPLIWTGDYMERYAKLMKAAHDALWEAGLADTISFIKLTPCVCTTTELRFPSEAGSYEAGTDQRMADVGWRPTMVEDLIVEAAASIVEAWPGIRIGARGVDFSASSDFHQWPQVDDDGNVGEVARIFENVIPRLVAAGGGLISVHADSLGLDSPTSGLKDIITEAGEQGATIGYQLAEKTYGWPQCSSSSLNPGNRPDSPCDHDGYVETLDYGVEVGGATFYELWYGAVVEYPAESEAFAAAMGWYAY